MTTIQQANKALLDYFKGDEMAAKVWKDKYALEGEITPDDMHRRMAKEFGRVEEKYVEEEYKFFTSSVDISDYCRSRKDLTEESIYQFFKDFKYIVPQGSIMSQLGAPNIGSLSNCFVIGQPEDSYGGIFQKDQEMAQLMKRRGGVGLDISTLRPVGTATSNAAKSSTGAVSFMNRFSNTTREVAQNGRRGALMLTIDCRHPDVLDFINVKQDRTKVTGANISVMLRDDFMEAVKEDADYFLKFPCDAEGFFGGRYEDFPYNTLVEYGNIQVKRVKAKEIYDAIVDNAHDNAEPGQMFVDHHHNYSPDGVYSQFKGVTTNPCGEIFMQPYDACRLIAVNFYSFVDNPFTDEARFNFNKFYKYNYEAMRLSDDLIDLELEHIDRIINKIQSDPEKVHTKQEELFLWWKIKETATASRRTGLGFTALGDMLAALNLPYDSEQGLEVIESVMHTKMESELDCTIDLGILRGTFTGWDKKLEFQEKMGSHGKPVYGKNDFYDFVIETFPEQAKRMYKYGRRNVSWSTIAPTGTVSLMTQTTSGLEPLFSPYYFRKKKVNPNDEGVRVDFTDANGDNWMEFPVMHPKFRDWLILYTQTVENTPEEWSSKELEGWFKLSPWYGSTANDIDWIQRIKIQGVLQKYISHSISSTINLPRDVSKEEVSKIYLAAFDGGLKGVTIYRDGSRDGVLTTEAVKKTEGFKQHDSPKRPTVLSGNIHRTTVKGTEYLVIVGFMDNHPYETFAIKVNGFDVKGNHLECDIIKVKKGQYDIGVKQPEGLVRLIQNFTLHMTPDEEDLTRMISTSLRHGAKIDFVVDQLNKSKGSLVDFSKAIARMLSRHVSIKQEGNCPECKTGILRKEEGCTKCDNCGYSAC